MIGVGAAAGTALGGVGVTQTAAGTGETRSGALLAGVSVQEPTVQVLDRFERWTGQKHAVVVTFAKLTDDRRATVQRLEELWQQGHVPLLVMEPTIGTIETTPTTISADIAAGDYDDELDAWRDALTGWIRQGWGRAMRRLYLEFAPEMNGDWVPWGAPAGGSTPDDYVAMFRRARSRLMSKGLTRSAVQWVWGPNVLGRGGIGMSQYYPGDDAVDWAALNGYNWARWGGWRTPRELYETAVTKLKAITDAPIAITEVACSSSVDGDNDPARKAEWITQLYDFAAAEGVKMVCWFNHTKETDWGVFDSPYGTDEWSDGDETVAVYDSYRAALNRPAVLGAHPTDRRRLTTREFRGEF